MQQIMAAIQVYGTNWCRIRCAPGACWTEKASPTNTSISIRTRKREALVRRTNRGNRSVPTIFFPRWDRVCGAGRQFVTRENCRIARAGLVPPATGKPS